MLKWVPIILMFVLFLSNGKVRSQDFTNPDLGGSISSLSDLPLNWQAVPFTDPNCMATCLGCATPDLTSETAPSPATGIIGNPYSDSTFVSGEFGGGGSFFHEGIMQTVSGFTIGEVCTVYVQQSVVKKTNLLDKRGSWIVYIDTTLAGITTPTYSDAPFNSTNFSWEARQISFTATDTVHIIKFLPMDDDTNYMASPTDTMGGLRMGIDCIYLRDPSKADSLAALGNDTTLYPGQVLVLKPSTTGATYRWQDGSTDSVFTVTEPGTYWVEVRKNCLSGRDTIVVEYESSTLNIPNLITPNGDGVNDKFVVQCSFNCSLEVYNRWGGLVYQNNDYKNDFPVQELADGVYFYSLTDSESGESYRGWITVMK